MAQPHGTIKQARRLRADQTAAEAILWSMLKNRQVAGLKFRRQAPLPGAIADFACHELKLATELDGGVHDLRKAQDAARDGG